MADTAVLGIDTSNYTTSAAYFDTRSGELRQAKKLLPVKSGEKGIRQADAVFHHTVQLPDMIDELGETGGICAVGVSDRPSAREGSYMPCFLVGLGTARAVSRLTGVPCFRTTHQVGHILAALYSAEKLDMVRQKQKFIAFHVSGGTTDMLLCTPDTEGLIGIERIGGSSDLKAGQAVDRCGVMLGLDFPCGKALEELASGCTEKISVRAVVKGMDCSLSGIENKCHKLMEEGADRAYIAAFCLRSVEANISALTEAALKEYGRLPVLYAGGVMSDKLIADRLKERFGAYFAAPEFSCDNAAGTAVYAAFMKGLI
ncbi:MAG: peptidase M22 [Ruminococcus sp.]|nr:peptidase M22 [Ruminococcus sp.]